MRYTDEGESGGEEKETSQIDHEKKVDQILNKINDGFSELILPKDNSVSRYIQYILICLRLTYIFEFNFTINKDRHLIQILRSFSELLNIENFTQEEISQLLSLEMFVLSEINDSKLREISYRAIPYKQFGETILNESLNMLEDLTIFNEYNKEFGLTNIKINDIKKEYFPKLIANACVKQSYEARNNYLKKLITEYHYETRDEKILLIYFIILETAKESQKSLKKPILLELSDLDMKYYSPFKKKCIEDLKDICF